MDQMDTLCRVCIKKAAECTSLNTKIKDSSNLSFFDFLNKCTSINARESDKLPQSLCSICTHSVKTFYSFLKLAEKSDIILREALKNSLATGRFNYSTEISCEEITIKSERIEEEPEELNQEESLHCQTDENSTGSSLYILDIEKEEPRVSESTSIVNFKDAEITESEKFHSNLDHAEESIEEPDDTLSCINGDLASIDAEQSKAEHDVAISLLKRRLAKNEEETDSQKTKNEYDNHIKIEHGCRNHVSSEAKDDSLKPHFRGHTENWYKCKECDMAFNDREEFRTHCLNHICGDKHECSICGKMFARRRYLNKHLVIHEEKKKYECSICGKKFAGQQNLYNHLVTHDEKKKYKCSICGKVFKHTSARCRHMKTHSGEKPFECEICGKKFGLKDKYKRHLRVHTGPHELSDKNYKCELCSKKFRSKQYLNVHMENHNGIKKKCDQCGKEFTSSLTLRRHMKLHTNPKPVKYEKCKICGKKFSSKRYLNFHMESHNGITKKCDHCDKEFANSNTLSSHMKRHIEPKPVKCQKCEICGKNFSSKRYLNFHMENHKGITKKCDQCGKELKNTDSLSRHMKLHSEPKCETVDLHVPEIQESDVIIVEETWGDERDEEVRNETVFEVV